MIEQPAFNTTWRKESIVRNRQSFGVSATSLSFAAALVSVLFCALTVSAAPPPGHRWEMTFTDEFEGTKLDLTKWDPVSICCGRTDHDEWYLEENCIVENGLLRLVIKREGIPPGVTCAGTSKKRNVPCNFTSGAVTSRTFAQQYGYFEMRGKFPAGAGMWPAFWTLAGRWEFDILEWWGQRPDQACFNFHRWVGEHVSTGKKYITQGMTTSFHNYGMEWLPENNVLDFYFDDKKVATLAADFAVGQDIPAQRLSLCLQDGGIDSTTPLPGYFEVDWVRVYKKGPAASGASLIGPGASGGSRPGNRPGM
jgi:beta-glucanase (GH16 family)